MLAIEYHVHIWQVSPLLSCGDTCQIWMQCKEYNRYLGRIVKPQQIIPIDKLRIFWTETRSMLNISEVYRRFTSLTRFCEMLNIFVCVNTVTPIKYYFGILIVYIFLYHCCQSDLSLTPGKTGKPSIIVLSVTRHMIIHQSIGMHGLAGMYWAVVVLWSDRGS